MNDAGVTPKDLIQSWQFAVEIDGFEAAYFTKADLPEAEFEEVTFAPAGSAFDQKLPGRAKFADITLEKGIPADSADTAAFTWLTSQMDFSAGTGTPAADYLKDIAVVEYSRDGQAARRWNLRGAWIKKYTPGNREGGKSENAMEQIVVTYQYYSLE